MKGNLIFKTDSYKPSHWAMVPDNTTYISEYFEPRKGEEIVFFGLQFDLKKLENFTIDIKTAQRIFKHHYGTLDFFNESGWEKLKTKYAGKLPIRIKALPEGTVIDSHNVLFTIENTDPEFFWLPGYIESMLMHVWYPSTVATNSRNIKKVIKKYLEETGNVAGLPFKLHDFGYRGASSDETAGRGGLAHLVNFQGSDTLMALTYGEDYYGVLPDAFSIPAGEHSVFTAFGRDHEWEAYKHAMDKFPTGLLAIVADSYDIKNAVKNIFGGKLFFEVKDRTGTIILRPDSGNPVQLIPELLDILDGRFGTTKNEKGYKILPDYLRLIWGDGINIDSITAILETMKQKGWSADNIAFGMGGALLQDVTRDDFGFAIKASWGLINGREVDIYKDPITDKGKASKRGRLKLIKLNGEYKTVRENEYPELPNELKTVYENGVITQLQDWNEIRARADVE